MSRTALFSRPLVCALMGSAAVFSGHFFRPQPVVHAALPEADAVMTSTREVTGLAVTVDGEVWAGTSGGVLRRMRDGGWRKYTRMDGLPAHEVRRIAAYDHSVIVDFPTARGTWDGERWSAEALPAVPKSSAAGTCRAEWNGAEVEASPDGLTVRRGAKTEHLALPPSTGSHVSAILPKGAKLWAAMFGDGLWEYSGAWKRLEIGLPEGAREITALAEGAGSLWVGTRREGVWSWDGREWRQHLQPDEPYCHNAQAAAIYRGNLYVSSLEDGLSVREGGGWKHVTPGLISSNAPRQMVEFKGSLYLHNGNGVVDRCDGSSWNKNVFAELPRTQVNALFADSQRLYVGQWGGWSEFDGTDWTHLLNIPELQGVQTTALLGDGTSVWIGTQRKGLAQWDRASGKIEWHDERRGMPDDWITCLASSGGRVFAGTFVGGLVVFDGARWQSAAELSGQNVTDLATLEGGRLAVATRTGLWIRSGSGKVARVARAFLDEEVQAVCPEGKSLWVGTRTSLAFLRDVERQ